MTKNELRIKYKHLRDSIPPYIKKDYDLILTTKILNSDLFKESDLLLLYHPIGSEFNTLPLFNTDKKIALPKTTDKIEFYGYLNELITGKFGIPEPTGEKIILDNFRHILAITPALALDKNKYRLGYGRGYYDKFLGENRNIKSMGICYPEIFIEKLPVDDFDIQLDIIIKV